MRNSKIKYNINVNIKRTKIIFSQFSPLFGKNTKRKCGRGINMNKIKISENIFPFFPLPCWKKLGGKKNKKICSRGKKLILCRIYTPVNLLTQK